jgi:glyoxylase I family protein
MSDFQLGAILHTSVIVKDTQRALAFYRDILELQLRSDRPELGYPGAWLNLGDQQLHLLELPNPDPVTGRPAHGGRDRHIAIAVKNLEVLKLSLDRQGLHYTMSKSGRAALFIRDPDGNALELIEVPG